MTRQQLIVSLTAVALVAIGGAPAQAQARDGILLDILRACARIDDPGARVACYDRNIGRDELVASAPAPKARDAAPRVEARAPSGFGGETVRTGSDPQPDRAERASAKVTAVAERAPGIYIITLDDGAQWQFAGSAPFSYLPPRPGSTVDIRRGALGSFLLRHEGQPSIRVQRVR